MSSVKTKLSRTKYRGVYNTISVIVQALFIAVLVRSFLFQTFNIPSGSMIPTLLVGDYLIVSKFSYGYSKYSLSFNIKLWNDKEIKFVLPFSGRVFSSPPQRGDVAVFKLPTDNETDYIKRVIGLPGDRIQMIGGRLYINDRPVKRELVSDFRQKDGFGRVHRVRRYRETLENGASYYTLDLYDGSPGDNTGVYVVPKGHYFMMGDNRDNSSDSRFFGCAHCVGYVPFENFIGRAKFIFFSHETAISLLKFWLWPSTIRWSRFFISLIPEP
ncbi:MAG: signal peptidase I [Hyphomicrobiales bacterium]